MELKVVLTTFEADALKEFIGKSTLSDFEVACKKKKINELALLKALNLVYGSLKKELD